MLELLTIVLASVQPEPPKTVNDQVLGEPADFSTNGPATVCLRELAVSASVGETVALTYSGIHNGSLKWDGVDGSIEFRQSESWLPPRNRGRLVGNHGGFAIYYKRENGTPAYLAFRPDEDGEQRLDTRISGTALDGSKRDESLLARLLASGAPSPKCDRTYAYGWGVIMGEESVISGPSND